MQLIHHFDVPKRRVFQGWAGVVSSWSEKTAPKVEFGTWKLVPPFGGIVTFDCQPFRLCMFGANTKGMNTRDKFTHFAFAGLGLDGKLVLQRLPDGTDARAVFAASGWLPPSIADMVSSVSLAANLDIEGMTKAFEKLMLECTDGFGMNLGYRPREDLFFKILASWPMLAPLNAAFLALRERRTQIRTQSRTISANLRKERVEKVMKELNAANTDITPVAVASRLLEIPLAVDGEIPPKAREKAKQLKKEFGDHFPELAI